MFSKEKKLSTAELFIVEQDTLYLGVLQCNNTFILHNDSQRSAN